MFPQNICLSTGFLPSVFLCSRLLMQIQLESPLLPSQPILPYIFTSIFFKKYNLKINHLHCAKQFNVWHTAIQTEMQRVIIIAITYHTMYKLLKRQRALRSCFKNFVVLGTKDTVLCQSACLVCERPWDPAPTISKASTYCGTLNTAKISHDASYIHFAC